MEPNRINQMMEEFIKATTGDQVLYNRDRIQLEFMIKVNTILGERSMKKKDLAAKLGITKRELTSLFRANTVLTLEMMAKIELALNVNIDLQLNKVAKKNKICLFGNHGIGKTDIPDELKK